VDEPRTLRTPRLLLRHWRDEDLEPFAALNTDPVVMEHFPAPLTRAESDALVVRIQEGFTRDGVGLWAVERADAPGLLGFAGLSVPPPDLPPSLCTEVGWRFAAGAWGHGYAWEAAHAAVVDGRARGVGEVVSFTATGNVRSQAVMSRLGMTHDPAGDFDHPGVPVGSPLRRHVLFRLPADRAPRPPPVRPA
jgi:RimJ/RimL family protein N-acetyltransferase